MKKQWFINFKGFQKVLSIFLIVLFLNPIYTRVLAEPSILQEGAQVLKSEYVDEVSDYVLNAPDLNEMVKRLNDPYSDYFTNEEYSEFINSINNTFCGIGIVIDLVPDGIKVSRIIDDSTAKAAGLIVGDIIVQADNNNLVGISSSEEAVKYIKGIEGSYVKLLVKRGTEVINFNIKRLQIKVPTVSGEMLAGNVAYITISSFGEDTADLFSAQLKKMDSLKANSYIIDLRFNGGGYISTALDIAGYFVGNNSAIIIEDKLKNKYRYRATFHENQIKKPVVFLINEYSASASEILAAAVKDYDKAIFIGTTTYGKGVAQQMFPLSDGSYLKLTVEKFYSPYGNIIHEIGVSPDYEIKDEQVDPLKVANLLLSSTSMPEDKRGYMKIELDGKAFYINLKMARSEENWSAYTYFLSNNSPYTAYSGTNVGWEKVTTHQLSNRLLMRYSNYKILKNLVKDINVDKSFKINFNMPIDGDSVKEQGIELISEETGKRVSIRFDINNNTIEVTPMEQLVKGQTYYLVINDSVKNKSGRNIKDGTIIKYIAKS